jgi:hypothetical protein
MVTTPGLLEESVGPTYVHETLHPPTAALNVTLPAALGRCGTAPVSWKAVFVGELDVMVAGAVVAPSTSEPA